MNSRELAQAAAPASCIKPSSSCAGGARFAPGKEGAPALSELKDVIIGRKRIAHALKRSPRTVSRWLRSGVLPVVKLGPFENSMFAVRAADIERLAAIEEPVT